MSCGYTINSKITFLNNSFNDLLKASVLNIQSSSLFIDNNSLFVYRRLKDMSCSVSL